MFKNKLFLGLMAVFLFASSVNGQVGINTTQPNENAIMDMVSTSKGLLIPRLTDSEVAVLAGKTPPNGLMIFNSTENCMQLFTGTNFECALVVTKADLTKDSWVDDPVNTQIKLNTKSDGSTSRDANEEMVIKDNGKVGIRTGSPDSTNDLQIGNGLGFVDLAHLPFLLLNPTAGSSSEKRQFVLLQSGDNDLLTFQSRPATNNGGINIASALNFMQFNVTAPANSIFLDSNGNVGIGGSLPPTEKLDVNGNARFRQIGAGNGNDLAVTQNGTLTTSASDRRLKTNIEGINYGLQTVMKLNPVIFNWKENNSCGKKDVGFIAQEVVSVVPECVFRNQHTGYYGINYTRLVPVLTKAIQQQQQQIAIQQEQIDELMKKLEEFSQQDQETNTML